MAFLFIIFHKVYGLTPKKPILTTGDDFAFIDPDSIVLVGPTTAVSSARFNNPTDFSGPDNFGTGPETFASSGSGDIFGRFFDNRQLVVPGGYVKNNPLSGTSTYSGLTLAALGMAPGSYTWSWSTLDSQGSDSVTLNVGSLSGVPIPAAVWLFGTALIGFIGVSRRTKVA